MERLVLTKLLSCSPRPARGLASSRWVTGFHCLHAVESQRADLRDATAPEAGNPAVIEARTPTDACSCSDLDPEWKETSLECFCMWFACPKDLETALLGSEAPACDPQRYPYVNVVLWTHADCKRIVLRRDVTDGRVNSWTFDFDTHALIGASRGAWPGRFDEAVCSNLPGPTLGVRTGWGWTAGCAEPTHQVLCVPDAGDPTPQTPDATAGESP